MTGSFAESVRDAHVLDAGELARVEKLYEEIILATSPDRVFARLAATYSEALMALAVARGQVDETATELDSLIHEVFAASPDLEMLLGNPAVHRKTKMAVIDKAIAPKATPLLADFLKLLCRHDRLNLLRLIAVSFQALRDKQANRVRILVESAVPLEKDQLEKIRQTLGGVMHQDPILINRVRPELLGGLLVHVGDKVYDSTVRSRLNSLRTQFLSRGSHEIQTRRDRFSSN